MVVENLDIPLHHHNKLVKICTAVHSESSNFTAVTISGILVESINKLNRYFLMFRGQPTNTTYISENTKRPMYELENGQSFNLNFLESKIQLPGPNNLPHTKFSNH